MRAAYQATRETWRKNYLYPDLPTAAYIAAIKRIALTYAVQNLYELAHPWD